MNKVRLLWLMTLGSLGACTAPGGSSSTGVGNPGVISLSIVTDDELELTPDDNGGAPGTCEGASGAAGAATDGEAGAAGQGAPSAAGAPATSGGDVALDDDLPRMSVQHAKLALGSLKWRSCATPTEETVVPGPFVLDLIEHTTTPEIPPVQEPDGGFCGLDAPLAVVDGPADLAGRSIFFDGVRSDGTFFLLYADVQATLRVRRHARLVWDASDTPAVLWAFRPRRWLSRAALDAASTTAWDDGRSAVVIDANRHPLLLAAIRHRLAGKSTLFRDLNQNRELDAEDRNVIVGDGSDDAD